MTKQIGKVLSRKETAAKICYYILRIFVVLYAGLLFLPVLNPARITERINKNLSLFTSGFFYGRFTESLGRYMKNGWVPSKIIRLDYFSSLISCAAAILAGIGGCISLGNNKLKRLGNIFMLSGGVAGFFSIYGINCAKNQLQNILTENPDLVKRVKAIEPKGINIFFVVTGIIVVFSILVFILTSSPEKNEKAKMETKYKLFLMLLPFIVLLFVFSYLPLRGWIYAFFDYKAGDFISAERFRGMYWFSKLFSDVSTAKNVLRVLRNTLIISGMGILTSWFPLVFAIFLSEIKNNRVKRFIKTCTAVPNFISWVVVYAIAYSLFSKEGFVSNLFGSGNRIMDGSNTWIKMWALMTWKELGWNIMIFLAVINGIEQELYDSATVDGASRFQKIFYITVPKLLPVYFVLLVFSVGGILSTGMEPYLLFENQANANAIQVLDLYIYKVGIVDGQISLATVIGILKTIVSLVQLFVAGKTIKRFRGQDVI